MKHALLPPKLHWTTNQTPKSDLFDDFYYSTDGGLEEIDYVFIQHNQLKTRFAHPNDFCIAEIGFGTGLNFLSISQLWLQLNPHQQLHFISFEKYPLDLPTFQKAHQNFPGLAKMAQVLQKNLPFSLPGWHTIYMCNKRIKLSLWFGDALAGLTQCDPLLKVDAWLLDGFTPSRNPDCWQPALFNQMNRLSHSATTFASFTAAGEVRRALQKAGFKVLKDVGFNQKREMIYGQLEQSRPFHSKAPWFTRPTFKPKHKKLIVIGAGLAGATTALEFAQRGWQVTLLEKNDQPALEASGNLAGAIHPLVTADWNLRSQWYLKGYEVTLEKLEPWLQHNKVRGKLDGLIHLATDKTTYQRIQDSLNRVGLPPNFAQWQEAEQLQEKLNTQIKHPGLFFPKGGWVQPSSIIKACLEHPNIQVRRQFEVNQIQFKEAKWQVSSTQQITFSAETLVVSTGSGSPQLHQPCQLPIRPVKGQVTHFSPEQVTAPLRYPVTHKGYSVSLSTNEHLSGATFEAPNMETELTLSAEAENLKITQEALPDWLASTERTSPEGKIGFRPTSPDHLPIVGPVADPNFLETAYFSQSHTHAVYRYASQTYLPGLYVNNGHGARGLMSVFLAAELLADLAENKPLNLPMSLYQAAHPARFKIRQWRSGKRVLSTD